MKTNAVRLLDQQAIAYELREYSVDPNDLAAEAVAAKIHLPTEQVFKTLVVRGEGSKQKGSHGNQAGILLAVIPGNTTLDLKAIAQLSGYRKAETVSLKEVQPLTGYIRGGVTALACKKPYPVFVDELMTVFERVSISAGMRGLQVLLAPEDYIRVVNATVGEIAKDKSPGSEASFHSLP